MSGREEWMDSIEYWLGQWARWMRGGQATGLGYPSRSAVLSTGGASEDFDDMVDRADLNCVKCTDAAIRSMELIEQAAIFHVHLAAVFRLRESPMTVYEACLPKLRAEMQRRGVF